MTTKKGFYHKKCFSCIKCKTQVGYFNAIEGPDDEVNITFNIFLLLFNLRIFIMYLNFSLRCTAKFATWDIMDPVGTTSLEKKLLSLVTKSRQKLVSDAKVAQLPSYFLVYSKLFVKQVRSYQISLTGQVFEAEKQVTKTGVIHKYCLACNNCNCNLDASSFFNGDDGEVKLMKNLI